MPTLAGRNTVLVAVSPIGASGIISDIHAGNSGSRAITGALYLEQGTEAA